MKVQEMGVLPLLPTLLNPQSSCTPKVANIIAEVAKNGKASVSKALRSLRYLTATYLYTFALVHLDFSTLKKNPKKKKHLIMNMFD